MAGLLLRFDGHVRGKLMIESIFSIPPTAALEHTGCCSASCRLLNCDADRDGDFVR
jgi:hypothetical protein